MIDALSISYNIGSDIIPSPDIEVDEDNIYFEYAYRLMEPEEDDSPVEQHWYEETETGYMLSEDTEIVEGKDYFMYGLIMVEPEGSENPSELGWYEATEPMTVSNLKSTLSFGEVVEDVPIEVPSEGE